MSKEKQIEEMANTVYDNRPHKDIWLEDAEDIAKVLYDAGYRKQSEGEWVCRWKSTFPQYEPSEYECSVCKCRRTVSHKYCPNCGAKMT